MSWKKREFHTAFITSSYSDFIRGMKINCQWGIFYTNFTRYMQNFTSSSISIPYLNHASCKNGGEFYTKCTHYLFVQGYQRYQSTCNKLVKTGRVSYIIHNLFLQRYQRSKQNFIWNSEFHMELATNSCNIFRGIKLPGTV